jgi:hypothetical protein
VALCSDDAELVVGTLVCLAAYFVFQASLSEDILRTSLGAPGVLRAVLGGGLYLTVLGLLGFGIGAILRSSAGAIATLFGLLFVLSILAGILPQSWQDTIAPCLPVNAGDAIYSLHRETPGLGAWAGFGVFCLYAATALGIGFLLITHRDA